MLNLVKMDIYRLFHSKAIKVGIIAAAIVSFFGMLLNFGILEILKLGMQDDPSGAESMGILFPIISWLNGVDFADVILTGTNALALFVSCMIASSFIGSEQSCGYIKNIAGQLSNRGMTVVSKFIVTCIVQLIVLVVYTLICIPCAFIFFSSYIKTYATLALIEGLLLRFLLFCAINAIVLFFCTLAKSHTIAMVIGAILGIGITSLVYLAGSALLGSINIKIDLAKLMPDGINGLINVSNLGTIAVRAIVVSIVFIAVFLIGAVLLFKKRDVK